MPRSIGFVWGLGMLCAAALGSAPAQAHGAPLIQPAIAGARILLTRDEALTLAFPGCEIERGSAFLKKPEQAAVAKLAGVKFVSGVVHPYVARKDGLIVGTAYFDTHRVRTMRQTLMVVVTAAGKLGRVELLAFAEPREYIPRAAWYAQFKGKQLDHQLRLKRDIKAVTGASLTAKATTSSARRILALHQTLARLKAEKLERKQRKAAERRKEERGRSGVPRATGGGPRV